MKMLNKKGELTTQQLVTIIILIISFVVVLFLLFRLGLGEETNKDICHNSVVMKSKSFTKSEALLDCRTTYVCISEKEDCENFIPTVTVDVKTEEEIINAIQKEIDDCDWMLGGGKLDYGGFWDFDGYHCAICSKIKFDKEIQNKYPNGINFNQETVFVDEEYSVLVKINPEGGEDEYVPANIIKSSEMNSADCGKFIHKA